MATVGLPFCAFKVLTGLVLWPRPWLAPLGAALLALGAIDALINGANLVALLLGRPRVLGVCLIQIALARLQARWDELGTAVDVMLSFALVAVVIGFGLLPTLPPMALHAWSLAVVLNVLGAGVGRLSTSLSSLGAER